ncbi:toxin-antitoxin system HicB family antitoxin, partial [Enterococcus faecium]|nr:toxin-antitoxin system HicB family antitoxin [Enterococcus faecium]
MGNKDHEKRFLLRLDQKLYERLQSEADEQGRSVNAHIVN